MNSNLSTTTNLLWLMFHILKAKTQIEDYRRTNNFTNIKRDQTLPGGC